jgi:hypothetical protein
MGNSADRRLPAEARSEIAGRLRSRRSEIEEAILARLYAVADPTTGGDVEYLRGLRAALSAAVGFGLVAIEQGDERSGSVPAEMLSQARHAARNRVGLETVLRRYFAGYTAMCDHLMQEARGGRLDVEAPALHTMQKELAALFDRIITTISEEYERESSRAHRSRQERRADKVRRLLAGELVDTAEFGQDFEAWHLGLICQGAEAVPDFLARTASGFGWRLLEVTGSERATWGWFSSRNRFDADDLENLRNRGLPPGISVGIGEPARGLRGWRLTHRQADAAMVVASAELARVCRYTDVSVLATLARDDDLIRFLAHSYLTPLDREPERGAVLRSTLGAYFEGGRQVSSAAAALGVARQTVTSRLHAIEEVVGRPLDVCATELELAVRMDMLGLIPSFGNDELM